MISKPNFEFLQITAAVVADYTKYYSVAVYDKIVVGVYFLLFPPFSFFPIFSVFP